MRFISDKSSIAVTVLLGILLLCLYTESLLILGYQWYRAEEYWRFFIFPITLYLVWHDRQKLLNLKVAPAYLTGVSLFALGCFSFIVWNVTLIDLSIEIGIVLLTLGIILLLYGVKFCAHIWLLIFYFLIATSVTDRFMSLIAIHLQNISAVFSSGFLNTTQWPVLCVERSIRLPHGILEVAQACSGTSQFTALIAIAIPLGYLRHKKILLRIILIATTLPITILFNSLRIILIAIYNYNGMHDMVHGPNDILKLPVIFPFALLMLYGVSVFVERFEKKDCVSGKIANSDSGVWKKMFPNALSVGIATSLVFIAFYIIIIFRPISVHFPFQQYDFPMSFNGWTGQNIDNLFGVDFLGKPDFVLNRKYLSNNGEEVDLQIAYFNEQTVFKRITTQFHKAYCSDAMPIVIKVNGSQNITLKKSNCVSKRNFTQFSWFVLDGKIISKGDDIRNDLIQKRIKFKQNNAAFVTLAIWSKNNVYSHNKSNDETIYKVVNDFYPHIEKFLTF